MQIQIRDYLSDLRRQPLLYVPNPGNAGDSIIAAATFQVMDELGLDVATPRPARLDSSGQILIYGGGGNLVQPGSFSSRLIAREHRRAKRLIVLPHTLKEVDALLAEFGSNVDIVCREATSYAYARDAAPRANVYLSHDMAFNLDTERLLAEPASVHSLPDYLFKRYAAGASIPSWQDYLRSRRQAEIEARILEANPGPELNCFRLDGESSGKPLPTPNADLSLLYNFGAENRRTAMFTAQAVARTLRRYRTIHTDRLHMAITGGLLGLDVRFHPNNYFKCQAVFDYSIRDRLPNVRWCSEASAAA